MQPSYSMHQLLALKDAWCSGTGLSVQKLDTMITGHTRAKSNRKLFTRIERVAGAGMSARSMTKVSRFFLDYWPEGVEWPAGVPRELDDLAA